MNKLHLLFFGTIFLFIVSSCSKDNAAAKKLEGSWDITSLKINNIELVTPITSADISFSSVVNNTGRFSTKTYLLGAQQSEAKGNFNVSDNGSEITLDDDNNTPGTGNIVELTDSYLHTTYIDGDDNSVIIKADKK